jgi:phage terminase large subunit
MAVDIPMLPKQRQFARSARSGRFRYCSFQGGYGSGKTMALAVTAWLIALATPSTGALLANSYQQLRDSTMRQFDAVGERYGFNRYIVERSKSERTIRLANGSVIVFRSLEVSERLKGPDWDWAGVDEASDCDERDFNLADSRLRGQALAGGPIMMLAYNPNPKGWIVERRTKWLSDGAGFHVASSTMENTFNAESYAKEQIAALGGEDSPQVRRLVYGEDAAYGGLVYRFSHEAHVVAPFKIPTEWVRWEAIDFGYDHPFCCLFFAQSGEDIYLYAEHYARETLLAKHADAILAIEKKHPTRQPEILRFADHDRQDRRELEQFGITTLPARKDVMDGIYSVIYALAIRGNGKPRLRVFSDCQNTIREFGAYEWDERASGDTPRKGKGGSWDAGPPYTDDAMDALRYGIHSIKHQDGAGKVMITGRGWVIPSAFANQEGVVI